MKTYMKILLAAFLLSLAGISESWADTDYETFKRYCKPMGTAISPGKPYVEFEYPDYDYNGDDDAFKDIRIGITDANGNDHELSTMNRCHDNMNTKNLDWGIFEIRGYRKVHAKDGTPDTEEASGLRLVKVWYYPTFKGASQGRRIYIKGRWDTDDDNGKDDYNVNYSFDITGYLKQGIWDMNERGSINYDGDQYKIEGFTANGYSGWTSKVWVLHNGQRVKAEREAISGFYVDIWGFSRNLTLDVYAAVERTVSVRNGSYGNKKDEFKDIKQRFESVGYKTGTVAGPEINRVNFLGRNSRGGAIYEVIANSYSGSMNFDVYRSGSSEKVATSVAMSGNKGRWEDTSANPSQSYTYDINIRDANWEYHRKNDQLNKSLSLNAVPSLTGSGTENSPYLIGNITDFKSFCWYVNSGIAKAAVAKLTRDISVGSDFNYSIGIAGNRFSGRFYGNGFRITLNRTSSAGDDEALFGYIDGATIKDLWVDGTINTSRKFGAGIVSSAYSGRISNCRSSVRINSSVSGDGTHGGIVGHTYTVTGSPTIIENCIFDGSINGSSTNACGGILGWNDAKGSCKISNTLCLGTYGVNSKDCDAIARHGAEVSNCYYLNLLNASSTNADQLDTNQMGTALTDRFGIGTFVYRAGIYPQLKLFSDGISADIVTDGTWGLKTSKDYSGVDFTLKGSYRAGESSTLVLPFDLTESEADEMGEFYELTDYDASTGSVYLRRLLGTKRAHTPYVFVPSYTTDSYEFTGKTMKAASALPNASVAPSSMQLTGTFVPVTAPAGAYGYSAGDDGSHSAGSFVKVGSGVRLPAFCAYLWLPSTTRSMLNVLFADENGSVTAIETLTQDPVNPSIYSLDGRKLDVPEKGINIINGKKVLVR